MSERLLQASNTSGGSLIRSTTATSYDLDGRLASVTDGNGNLTQYNYGGSNDGLDGLLKSITYPTYTEEYKYDNRNRITQTIQILDATIPPAAATTRYTTSKEYDARGNMIAQIDPLNRKTQMRYDALNRLTQTIDPMTPVAGITRHTYDTRDNLRLVTDALGSQTQYEYDRANRMLKEIRPLSEATLYAYDAAGNLTTRTNAKGDVRQYAYDAANRRTQEQHQTSTGIIARTINYSYDERGLLASYTDTGDTNLANAGVVATANSASYSYDRKAQKTSEAVTVQISGSASAPINTTKTSTTTYHPNGLKASITYPNLSNANASSAGTVTYRYDTNNQLKQITLPSSTSASPKTIDIPTYRWTSPSQKFIPGAVINMNYDALLRPTRITSQALGVNGAPQAPTGAIIQDTALTYNDVSNIIKRQTEYGLYNYGYDDLDRLTQVVPPSVIPHIITPLPIEGYTYDAVHNRKTSLHQSASLTNAWQYNAHHQLTQYGEPSATPSSSLASIVHPKVTQTYDVNGHLLTKTVTPEDTTPAGIQAGKQSHRYTYSVSERLLQANDNSGNEIARYAYDPFGRRIIKTVSQNLSGQGAQIGATAYFYSDEGLIGEVDGNNSAGNITTTYGWMPNGTWGTAPIYKRDHAGQSGTPLSGQNAVEHYYHHDHLGTPQRLTNQAGEITWRAVSEAFGKTFVDTTLAPTTTAATINNLRFPGQVEDPETGTHYNMMRDYDPSIGRYVQSDPIGLKGGLNTYAYVENYPLFAIDPQGLKAMPSCAGSWSRVAFEIRRIMVGFTVMPGPTCECFWACIPCEGTAAYGNYKDLPSSFGATFVDYTISVKVGSGGTPKAGTPMKQDGNPKRGRGGGDSIGGNQCLCGPPGPETGCPYCKENYVGPVKRKYGSEQ
nr:RHS repeat-associated core domain-containing protein [Rhodoferax sp.]